MTWLAHKAVTRGLLIRQGAKLKRQLTEKSRTLLTDLKQAETRHKASPTHSNRQEVQKIRATTEALQMQQVERAICKMKTNYYRQGNRAGKILTSQLRERTSQAKIPYINDDTGTKILRRAM
ncbi:Hypothetical predicted protein [Pelobates cultripes]|uniref:Uncharacterized protein n=1 Tax=Pelobates cultripes TaxID=61616 RepID=A0AAD1R6R1_PELCU|nr:Hypothetical predicted protein [Pelobates cultripes]